MRTLVLVGLLVALGASAGCGSSGVAPDGGGADAASALRSPGCPATPSTAGGCQNGVVCDYPGSDPYNGCPTRLTCVGGGWQKQDPGPVCGTNPRPCPASYAAASGQACGLPDGGTLPSCDYPEGRCECQTCFVGTGGNTKQEWACRAWDSGGDQCPPLPVLAGTACTMAEQFCIYGGCGVQVGGSFKCDQGYWSPVQSVTGSCGAFMCASP
jgi:hypothetical protein